MNNPSIKLDLTRGARFDEASLRLIREVSDQVKPEYLSVIDQLSNAFYACPDWWVSEVASRNVTISHLYEHLWKLALLDRLIASGTPPTEILVDSLSLRTVIRQRLTDLGIADSIVVVGDGPTNRSMLLGSVLRMVKTGVRAIAGWSARDNARRDQILSRTAPLTLIGLFAGPPQLVDGQFIDRYYGNLGNHIPSNEQANTYYLPVYYGSRSRASLTDRLSRTGERFLFAEDFLKLEDYLYAAFFGWRITRLKPPPIRFRGFDIAPLIRADLVAAARSGYSVEALLRMRLPARLKAYGVPIRLIINWYEGLSIERGLNLGMAAQYPQTPVWGYAGYFYSSERLSVFPTEIEQQHHATPHKVFAIGGGFKDKLRTFAFEFPVDVAPAFRFRHLWDRHTSAPESPPSILVALPLDAQGAAQMMEALSGAISILPEPLPRILVRKHPANPAREIPFWKPGIMELSDGDFSAALGACSILIGSASSAALEALLAGRRVIVPESNIGPTDNTIPDEVSTAYRRVTSSPAEMAEAITAFCEASVADPDSAWRESLKEAYCEPVSDAGVRRLLGLDDVE
jgi:hypothetical protein